MSDGKMKWISQESSNINDPIEASLSKRMQEGDKVTHVISSDDPFEQIYYKLKLVDA